MPSLAVSQDTWQQHQLLCHFLAQKRPRFHHPRLEVWYGSGNNGKTHFLHQLTYGAQPSLIAPTNIGCKTVVKNNTMFAILVEDVNFSDQDLVDLFITSRQANPTMEIRYILTSNMIPSHLSPHLIEVFHFPHKF